MQKNWYKTSDDWYEPLSFEDKIKPAERKQKRKTRLIGITVVALVLGLACGTVMIKMRSLSDMAGAKDSGFGNFSYSADGSGGEESLPENFSEFFSTYYTQTDSSKVEIDIPAVQEKAAFTAELMPAGEELTLQELYSRCAGSIVGIAGYEDENISGYNWGTGIVLSEDGLVLTNTHVIDGCVSAEVILSDGERCDASLVGADSISDIALLKIDAKGLTPVVLGDSDALSVGQKVAAIGNPLGDEFSGTLTDGIISAINRDISYNSRSMTLIQTNAALNEGNSGGALFNMAGQVIGVTNMKMMSSYSSIEGIGFAIPSATVIKVADSLVSFGEVRGRPSIGITVGQIPENVGEHYQLPEGLYVAGVADGSDAKEKGITEGDIITAVNGAAVTTTAEVNDIKDTLSVGDKMTFSVWRNGESFDVDVVLVDTNDIYK